MQFIVCGASKTHAGSCFVRVRVCVRARWRLSICNFLWWFTDIFSHVTGRTAARKGIFTLTVWLWRCFYWHCECSCFVWNWTVHERSLIRLFIYLLGSYQSNPWDNRQPFSDQIERNSEQILSHRIIAWDNLWVTQQSLIVSERLSFFLAFVV